jgi:hypothetical protein
MAIKILSCPSIEDVICPAYVFSGFQTSSNKYGSVTICDWDCCLYGIGTTNDSVNVPGYGTLYQPTPPADPNCITGENVACDGAFCFIDDNGNNVVISSWDGRVDGHIVYKAINECQAIVIEATGSLETQVGNIVPIPDIASILGPIQSDQYAYSSINNSSCNNPDNSKILIVLGDPSPDNT